MPKTLRWVCKASLGIRCWSWRCARPQFGHFWDHLFFNAPVLAEEQGQESDELRFKFGLLDLKVEFDIAEGPRLKRSLLRRSEKSLKASIDAFAKDFRVPVQWCFWPQRIHHQLAAYG